MTVAINVMKSLSQAGLDGGPEGGVGPRSGVILVAIPNRQEFAFRSRLRGGRGEWGADGEGNASALLRRELFRGAVGEMHDHGAAVCHQRFDRECRTVAVAIRLHGEIDPCLIIQFITRL